MTMATQTKPRQRHKRVTSKLLVSWLLLLSFLLTWWLLLRPSTLGGPLTFITVSGTSMEPGLHTGDLSVVYEQDSYDVGDVVAFRHQTEDGELGSHVIHRIRGGDATAGFVMRGDNNSWDDPWKPTADQMSGEMLFSVPGVGTAVMWLSKPLHFAALLASLMIGMIVAGGPKRETWPSADNDGVPTP